MADKHRAPGARTSYPTPPPGTKGISLFIVPKSVAGSERCEPRPNAVKVARRFEHKMGIKALGDLRESCSSKPRAFWVGEPHKGLRCMFTMMNVAAARHGHAGFSRKAKPRFPGLPLALRPRDIAFRMRSLTGPKSHPNKPADPIIVHPDVRRMLLTQKALHRRARARVGLSIAARSLTIVHRRPNTDEATARAESDDGVADADLQKRFMTDTGFEAANLGYASCSAGTATFAKHGMEQLVRDRPDLCSSTKAPNGIQSLDLLGRKVLATGRRPVCAPFNRSDRLRSAHRTPGKARPQGVHRRVGRR